MENAHTNEYKVTARHARLTVLELIYKAQTSHIGSNFSCIDIMTVLFSKFDWEKDKFVLSKGWAAASLYYFLYKYGRITEEELNSYCQEGSKFIGLAEPITEDIPIAGGSMGLGLPGAVGLALAKKIKREPGTVYCLMSDGELQSGTTWESALIAAQHKLDNLRVIVDNNGFQAMGPTKDVLEVSFPKITGWGYFKCDGHNYEELASMIHTKAAMFTHPMPIVLSADTTKGKGVSFMENANEWHYRAPEQDEYEKAKAELCQN